MFVSVHKMVQGEQRAIRELLIPSRTLMYNAGKSVAELVLSKYKGIKSIGVVSGFGNNGGDGFVTGMLLSDHGLNVKVLSLGHPSNFSADARHFLDSCLSRPKVSVKFASDVKTVSTEMTDLHHCDVLIDALLGTGFAGSVQEPIATAIRSLPRAVPVVAVDIPSGLNGTTGEIGDPCVRASETVTFAKCKIGMRNRREYTGEITVADIGIPEICFDDEKWFKLTHKHLPNLYPESSRSACPCACFRESPLLSYSSKH